LETPPRIELREITRANLRDFLRLKVRPEQEHFVASNAVSIAQAHFHPEAWFRGLCAGDEPVGFAMLEDWTQCPTQASPAWHAAPYVGLWRFMIDARFQATGCGAQAMRLLIEHARTRPGAAMMLLSYVPGEGCPQPFYSRFGFEETGEMDGIERVMRLAFDSDKVRGPT
jgi:diamine N-acetyltransferase